MDALIANLHYIIRWPKPSEFEKLSSEFEKVGRFFPNVIGAIHGLHLEIELTEKRRFEPSFINYKQLNSLDLQVSSLPKKLMFCNGQFSHHIHNVFIANTRPDIQTHFCRLAWPSCTWFRLEAQSFVTDSATSQ